MSNNEVTYGAGTYRKQVGTCKDGTIIQSRKSYPLEQAGPERKRRRRR